MTAPDAPFDAVLFLSFGGPDRPDDVRPFLENVTRGRGVPPERLDDVVEHYLHFGGVSPINRLNLDMIEALSDELDRRGRPGLPIHFGNRNWHPFAADAVSEMVANGHRRILVFPTSAWGGYSGCRQYHEDIEKALDSAGLDSAGRAERRPERAKRVEGSRPVVLRKLPQFCEEPEFRGAVADGVRAALDEFPDGPQPRLVFTAHSIPESADRAAGPVADGGRLYSRQVADASAAVAGLVGIDEFDVVWQSRSGPPQIPWLAPDICDHLRELSADGVSRVVVCPIGFISDHLEVVWDLDTEAADLAVELGIEYVRVATAGTSRRFVAMVADLIERYVDGGGDVTAMGCGDNGGICRPDCCVPVRRPGRSVGAASPSASD
ncbi:ferrochelatase [Gordonia sp. HY002]|uniref:ferrochelatase n=1 Tax=Gordonia zhenghanii TaxID=2911516 RepID=UPI001EF0149C|nr:ferrochelatase [Gordonia zhenghanii]MCF8569825.1 ferrochelatase [Gordonia zhenghanii]MCF8602491.1 ferrochelatase [Gordonia zhenghanii]